ncbi:MAG: hypothetical protein J6T86_07945 [Bacteroidales bacterium]|nr:hypothetical protein [Bacteroidales bacterium]
MRVGFLKHIVFLLVLSSCMPPKWYSRAQINLRACEELAKQDSSLSTIHVIGVVQVDTIYQYNNRGVNPDLSWEVPLYKNTSDRYYCSTKNREAQGELSKNNFRYKIFAADSYVVTWIPGIIEDVLPAIKDSLLKSKITHLLDERVEFPYGFRQRQTFFLRKEKRYYSVGSYRTNDFLYVQMPVWFFNLNYSKHHTLPAYYFLEEEECHNKILKVLIPLPEEDY